MSIAEKLLVVSNNLVTESEEITEQESLLQQVNAALDGKTSSIIPDYTAHCFHIGFNSLNWLNKADVVINVPNCNDLSEFWNPTEGTINTVVEHLTVNASRPTKSMNMFLHRQYQASDTVLKRVTLNVDTSNASTWYYAFSNSPELETIDGAPLNLSKAIDYNAMFHNDYKLAEVRFVEGSIVANLTLNTNRSLSNASVQSVIDGLADMTGQSAKTLTFHATVGAKLTDEQKATIASKNWTLAY